MPRDRAGRAARGFSPAELGADMRQALEQGRWHASCSGSRVTLTHANHSSSSDGVYTGESCGLVVETPGEADALLRRRHERLRRHGADRADLRPRRRGAADRRPLHDGPARGRRRRRARRRASASSPSHYGTFPLLTGTPDALRDLLPAGIELLAPAAGRDGRAVSGRERWFGATGRQGPGARARRHARRGRRARVRRGARCPGAAGAHADGIPVVVHATTIEAVAAALARPEVACVLVDRRGAAHARSRRPHVWLVTPSSRPTRSAPVISLPDSGVSRHSRSSSPSARSCRGRRRTRVRSQLSPMPTRATGRTGSRSSRRASRPTRSSGG